MLGTSRTLSVGPVSIAAIMVASSLSEPEISALGNAVQSGLILSMESGLLLMMALFRMGGLVHFISHPVLTGFTSGASILIIISQLPHLAGLKPPSCGFDNNCYISYFKELNIISLCIGAASLALLLFFGKPHIAVVGRIPATEHFRNVKRHSVETWHHLLFLRIDESITFANVEYIENFIASELRRQPDIKHIIMIFTSVSDIDATALEALENLNQYVAGQPNNTASFGNQRPCSGQTEKNRLYDTT